MDTDIMVPVGPAVVGQVLISLVRKSNKYQRLKLPRQYRARDGCDLHVLLAREDPSQHARLRINLLHPGWVHTDMDGPGAPVTITECIDGVTDAIRGSLTHAYSGAYIRYNGERLPW
ncbi:hypothetical protein L226DRAFT_574384 [Lentinus tigrinus ALCF2SS1-7]|uniref:Uncharacterized protein n=1 Tax=Lentinus tigrinus ALCF2SS1-6 TaxID=1328759 RepID=A0A5C2SBA1_9APHY|nr:hypothetical protein L227DRAFT_611346 [Lentinus tigrinus ALCF2SS1-6]RPD70936.1 hypothetical protein L226DRAFT_574384 [Lentinus tigrinus ALCF2SS1-7]